MKNKIIILSFFLVLFSSISFGDWVKPQQTISQLDEIYCRINGNCTLNLLNVINTTTTNILNVSGTSKLDGNVGINIDPQGVGGYALRVANPGYNNYLMISPDATKSGGFFFNDGANRALIANSPSDDLVFYTGGIVHAMTIDNNQDVGIGTTNPSERLDVVGDTELNGDLNVDSNTLYVNSTRNNVGIGTNSPYSLSKLHLQVSDGGLPTLLTAGDDFIIQNNGAPGNGAGMTFITGTTGLARFSIGDTDADARFSLSYYNLNEMMEMRVGGVNDRFTINGSNGNVGIGTDNALGRLHVYEGNSGGTPAGTADTLVLESNTASGFTFLGGSASTLRMVFGDSEGSAQGRLEYENSNDAMVLRTNALERVRIDSDGKVGIGTSNPSYSLDIDDDAGVQARFYGATQGSTRYDSDTRNWNLIADSNPDEFRIRDVTAGTNPLVIDGGTGNIGMNTATPNHKLVVNGDGYIKDNVYYDVSSWTNTTAITGGISELSNCSDTKWFNISEETGSPGMDTIFIFDGVESFRDIVMDYFYDGTHDIHLNIYNSALGVWIPKRDLSGKDGVDSAYFSTGGSNGAFINSTGSVMIELEHPQAGNVNHIMHIPCLRLQR